MAMTESDYKYLWRCGRPENVCAGESPFLSFSLLSSRTLAIELLVFRPTTSSRKK